MLNSKPLCTKVWLDLKSTTEPRNFPRRPMGDSLCLFPIDSLAAKQTQNNKSFPQVI